MHNHKLKAIMTAIILTLSLSSMGCGETKEAATESTQNKAPESIQTEEKTDAADTSKKEGDQAAIDLPAGAYDISGDNLTYVAIEVQDFGTITVALDRDVAPLTVDNFVKLAGDGFYDGLTFHRIIDGFMIQGGDPLGNGTGGSDETVKGEFSANGVDNPITHVRGAISMARSMDPDSGSSQFFIVQADSNYLDGQYAGFGYVTEGMEVVDQICAAVTPVDGNGTILPDSQPVITSIKVLK